MIEHSKRLRFGSENRTTSRLRSLLLNVTASLACAIFIFCVAFPAPQDKPYRTHMLVICGALVLNAGFGFWRILRGKEKRPSSVDQPARK